MQLKVLSIIRSGEVNVSIDDKRYTYYLDAAHLPKFKSLMSRSPGKALNLLKKVSREVISR